MVLEGLLVFGGAMLISVFGHIIFHCTGIPESAFMILLGVLAGPVLNVITPAGLEPVTPYFYTLSLLIVLFESGLSTHISEALKAMKNASIFTVLILISTTGICGGFLHFLLGWGLYQSLVFGIICSGTSTPPVAYFTSRMSMDQEVKSFLVFESIFNDITLLTAVTFTVHTATLSFDIGSILTQILRYTAVPIVYGCLASVLWAYLLIRFSHYIKVRYISTLAFAIFLYVLTEFENGSGILAVLIFSIILGNMYNLAQNHEIFSQQIEKFLSKLEEQLTLIRGTQTEISFLAKNSFFLIMGILFDPSSLGSNIFWLTALLIVLIIMARAVSTGAISLLEKKYLKNIFAVSFMVPRGLTFSLAAFLTIKSAVNIPLLKEIVTIMVMLTTLITTIGYFLVERVIKT